MPNPFEHLSPRTIEQLASAIENKSRQTATERNRALQEAIERKKKAEYVVTPLIAPPMQEFLRHYQAEFLTTNPPDNSQVRQMTAIIWLLMKRLGVSKIALDLAEVRTNPIVSTIADSHDPLNKILLETNGPTATIEQPKPPKEEGPIRYYDP